MNTARPTEKMQTAVHLQEWPSSMNEVPVNVACCLLAIEGTLHYCADSSKPALIGISGVTGSGKSVLARILATNMKNARLLDLSVLKPRTYGENMNAAVIDEMRVHDVTYIVDEAGYCNPSHLVDAVTQAVENNCKVILFFQCFDEVPVMLKKDLQCFELSSKNGLIMLNTHNKDGN